YHPLDAERESKTLGRRTAQHLRESVISTAADDRVLRAKLIAYNLKCGPHVVVKAPHKPFCNDILYASRIEQVSELLKVGAARITQMVGYRRQFFEIRLAGLHFAVEQS